MFAEYELNTIFEDQRLFLESSHSGDICNRIQDCPIDHFEELDSVELDIRQSIMNKILDDASKRG